MCLVSLPLMAKPVVHIQQWQTKNGARVLFVRAPQIPMLDAAVIFKAGSVYDAKHAGLATLTNAMLNEGAGRLNANQLAETFDGVGAEFSNGVDKESGLLAFRSLVKPQYLRKALNNFELILKYPTFPNKSIVRIKKQMLISLQASKQQPNYVAQRTFSKLIWGKHPYANSSRGNEHSIPLLNKAQVKMFYQRYYVANNATVILVGDVSTAQAKIIAEKIMHKLPAGKKVAPLVKVPNNKAAVKHLDFPSSQTSILIGEVGVSRNDKNYLALSVASYILGGNNLNSILMSTVREKYGLTYGIYGQFQALTQKGAFIISLKTRNDQAARAIDITKQELSRYIENGPTQKQLNAAKSYLLGSFPLAIASNASLLQNLATIATYNLPLNYLDTYRKRVRALTVQKIKTDFQKAVRENRLVVVSVGGKS
jgi:zinc protease